jgi:hypothetical protein
MNRVQDAHKEQWLLDAGTDSAQRCRPSVTFETRAKTVSPNTHTTAMCNGRALI